MAWVLLWVLSVAVGRVPTADDCAAVERAIGRLWTARAVTEAVSSSWPDWRPTLVGTRFRTREGLLLRITRREEADCPGLPVPARILARGRAPKESYVGLRRQRGAYWLLVAEGRDGMPTEDLVAAVVHQLFHVHQYRTTVSFRDVNGQRGAPDASWATRQVAQASADATQMIDITQQLLVRGVDASTLQRLVSARKRHFVNLDAAHPRVRERVALAERVEGSAAYMELQVVLNPRSRQLLLDAGVPPFRLQAGEWRASLLEVSQDYAHATGIGVALVLDAAGMDWKGSFYDEGFDTLLERAVIRSVSGR